MGEVYRARDVKLGREVAVKVLPESLAGDPERLARFEREARTLASVNHPNIVTIYSVEEAGDVRLLAMELVEGQTLDLAIPAGGLPLARFFELAVPMADALSAAHERGIVHRDLKPGNVMITAEGRVKVLDFGLAKIAEPDSGRNMTDLPTASRVELTGEGTVFGTVAYMSPEQARGGKIDARSDVFSLGVVLYEMLTGDRPFRGQSSVDLISSILRDRPSSVTEIRTDLPPHVGRILRRCLEKNPRDRYQTSRDVFNELRDLQSETSAGMSGAASARKPASGGRAPATTPASESWVAVLPFQTSGTDEEATSFADGLGETITTGLSRFRYLSVVARSSAERLKGHAGDEQALGAELGARYVLAGSVRKAGAAIRVSARLVDAASGAQLWAQTYDRDLQAAETFAVQDDVAARMVATVADSYGVLVHSLASDLRQKDDVDLSPCEWMFKWFEYRQQITPQNHAVLKDRLERAVKRDSRESDLWACLAQVYTDEHAFGFQVDSTSLDRALAAARRAVELDRTNQFALVALAQAYFFRQDLAAFRPAAEQAMALNPLNTDAVGILGLQIVHTGEFQRGAAIMRRAMALNPNHAGWMHYGPIWEHFERGEYERALEHVMQVNMPSLFWQPLAVAAICGLLGRSSEGAAAVKDLLALDPGFASHARRDIAVWHFASGLGERILEGLGKAGLNIDDEIGTPALERGPAPTRDPSGQARAEEGFWVAVLPFQFRGSDSGLESLADGLSEAIVTGLARFSYLRVIARSSTSRYATEAADVRAVGAELGARYVLEGSLRQAGSRVRIAAQLVDAVSGAHLWAETYDRPFEPDAIFELQDDVVPRIVSTIADMNGILPHAMSEALRGKDPNRLTPYEAVLRSFGYLERLDVEEHAIVRSALERTVSEAPGDADGWAMLSFVYAEEHKHGFNVRPGSLDRALDAARRAVATAPSNHLGYHVLAQALFFRRELHEFRSAAERAIALNPMDACTTAFMGLLMAYAGDWERGCALTEHAMELNPNHPGWYRFGLFRNAYRKGDYRGAVDVGLKFNMPSYFYTHAVLAAAYGQLGEKGAAKRALAELLRLKPEFAAVARQEIGKWYIDEQPLEEMLDGLRKAGLKLDETGSGSESKVPASERPKVAIAVLPFSDLSAAKDQEYLCEGMAEEIMNALVRVPGIRVASRTSAFRARQEGKDLAEIARALSVGHVLEGSIRAAGKRLRVTAQLTNVETGFQLWSERFDREAEDVFALQDDIARGVVEAVRARLTPGAAAVQARPQVGNVEAYRHYLRGRFLRYTKNDPGSAQRSFEQAVALDPSHAPSWVGLAETNALAAMYGLASACKAYETAREALAAAASRQGESAEARFIEGMIAWAHRDWRAAEGVLSRAIDLRSDYVEAHCWLALLLADVGRVSEAMTHLERAREADPLAPYPYAMSGVALLTGGRAPEAEGFFEQALAFDKENTLVLWGSGLTQIALGRSAEGVAMLERATTPSHRGGFIHGALGWALARAGRMEDARAILDELRDRPASAPALVSEAWLLAELGDLDGAFAVLELAEAEYQGMLPLVGMPGFDRLRDDPRFAALVGRLGLGTRPKSSSR
jgi:TolB-like protein/Flp pilus assembly protein TadD